jgi:hypothetical protein
LVDIIEAFLLQGLNDFTLRAEFLSLSSALNALTSSSCFAELRISHPIMVVKTTSLCINMHFYANNPQGRSVNNVMKGAYFSKKP